MKKLKLILGTVLLFGLIETSYANLQCKEGGTVQGYTSLPDTISVPNEAPKGTVLWRSPVTTLNLTCQQEMDDSWTFPTLHLNYDDPTNTALGSDVEMGIHYNGQDYICSNMMSYCAIKIDLMMGNCDTLNLWRCQPVKLPPITYSLILVKKSPPGTNTSGPVSGLSTYKAFQVGRQGTYEKPNPRIAYSLTVRNMHQLTYIACPATVSFSTQDIIFPTIFTSSAVANAVASRQDLNLRATRRCNDDTIFSMNVFMKPAAGSTITGDNLLIPKNKITGQSFDTVGIELLRNGVRIPFNQEHPMFDASKDAVRNQKIEANLIWRTNTPQSGEFTGGLIMEFFHR